MNNPLLGRGVVAALLQTALLASCCAAAATINSAPPHSLPARPSGITGQGFPEPSLSILGTEVRAAAVKCIRTGGNFYYHGGVICEHVTT